MRDSGFGKWCYRAENWNRTSINPQGIIISNIYLILSSIFPTIHQQFLSFVTNVWTWKTEKIYYEIWNIFSEFSSNRKFIYCKKIIKIITSRLLWNTSTKFTALRSKSNKHKVTNECNQTMKLIRLAKPVRVRTNEQFADKTKMKLERIHRLKREQLCHLQTPYTYNSFSVQKYLDSFSVLNVSSNLHWNTNF